MKNIVLILCLLCLSQIEACHIDKITTKSDVKVAQKCISKQLKVIKEHLDDFYIYENKVKKVYEKLKREGSVCTELRSMLTVNQVPKHCNLSYKTRFMEFDRVGYQWADISKKIKKIKNQKIALGLKKNLLESSYDLIIKRAQKNYQLKTSIDSTMEKIEKTEKMLKELNENKDEYIACIMLELLKNKIEIFEKELKNNFDSETQKSLNKLEHIYLMMKREALFCR